MREILKLDSVSHYYQQKEHRCTILDKADYCLYQGQMVAVLAPSGAGKSTFLHIAGLLETPKAGEVIIDGEKAAYLSNKKRTVLRRDKIGFIYQLHHLLPEFTALENVMMPLLIKGCKKNIAREKATELLASLFLQDRLRNRPAQLSGGEQQRVAIARAVVNDPLLLLADEPTGNLDPDTAEEVFQLLLSLVKANNMAALIATHDHSLAQKMDAQITLVKGKLYPFNQD